MGADFLPRRRNPLKTAACLEAGASGLLKHL
jgi:hypothetical protein